MGREPRAVLLLLALAAAGHAGRAFLGRPDAAPGQLLARSTGVAGNSASQRARAVRLGSPLRAGETVDLNTASAEEIARLPRIGMSLAKRMVEDRTARGPFRGPGDLDRVPGIGPGLLGTLGGRVRYGAGAAEVPAPANDANLRTSGAYAPGLEGVGGGLVDLNSATEADLVALPGIGPSRARAILAYRRENGSFAAVSDLGRVSGFGRSLLTRLAPLLTAR
jgi:competence protein ComEA